MMLNKTKSFRALIFDLDGTVTLSQELHYKAYAAVFKSRGVNFTKREDLSLYAGKGSERTFRGVFAARGEKVTPAQIQKMRAEKKKIHNALMKTSQIKLVPGLLNFVKKTDRMGVPRIIATGSHRHAARSTLQKTGMKKYFPQFLCSADVKEPKPSPEIFLKAAARLGVKPGDCVVFEDAVMGIKAARKAGMYCVGVATGLPPSILKKAGAHIVINDYNKLIDNDFLKSFTMPKDEKAVKWLEKYMRYVNYLGAGQLYLKENCLLEKELKIDHIKERVLGHWGTVPGLNLIYAHLNYLIHKHNADIYYVCGPGHGAPAVLANLFAENTLAEYYPGYDRDKKGTEKLLKYFSWPGGFPSHTNPGTPGSILEGGELGYSLSTAYGSVLDNPDLIAACVVGDGESETGPLAAAWHGNKFLNPKYSGAVLPILHANGYKITGPTIYAYMSDDELISLFTGFGYEPRIVDFRKARPQDHQEMIDTFEWAYQKIRAIQKKARAAKTPVLKPRWPMIVLRSEKGWSGIKTLHKEKIEGTYRSHGIPSDGRSTKEDFLAVKAWLESYKIHELVDKNGRPLPEVLEFVPKGKYRMGMNAHTNPDKKIRKELILPEPKKYEVPTSRRAPKGQYRNTGVSSDYMRDMFKLNSRNKNFRFFCPDETESNKYMSLFETTTRAFMWPLKDYDTHVSPDGRVMEVLSEHNLIGWLQGYLLTGRHGVFVTYEAFAMIIASMADQYAKFIKQALKVKWRNPVSSMNIILTSVGWRQEHNGFSHQNPGFISNMVEKHGKFCSVYFPCDANALTVTLEDCFKRVNSINVIAASKQPMPQWITVSQAKKEIKKGIAVWDWINPSHAKKPDVVLAASGDYMVRECMAAISLLRKDAPEFKIRFVNVSEITALGMGDERRPLMIGNTEFEKVFTKDKPIIYNFHGYPGVIQNLIYGHKHAERFSIHGYQEEGTTTTPFEMMVLNKASRYHLMIDALEKAAHLNPVTSRKANRLIKKYKKFLRDHEKYIRKYGKDMKEVNDWTWNYK